MKRRFCLPRGTITGLKYGLFFGVPFGQLFIFTVGHGDSVWDAVTALLVSVIIAVALTAHFGTFAPALRKWPFLPGVIASGLVLSAIIGFAISVSVWLMRAAEQGISPFDRELLASIGQDMLRPTLGTAVAATFLSMLVMMFFMELSRKLGPGVLRNWLMGRYRQPRVESRVFMFLDLKDSTELAERLGHLKFSALVRDFFDDLTMPLADSKGTVSHYIGDEAVLTWPIRVGVKNANCIQCFFLMREQIDARRDYYMSQYGIVPGFKAGVHLGEAVVTEVGQIKSEIVYHGDVLNTTARITSLCSEVGEDLLISAELAAGLEMADGIEATPLGEYRLKGKSQEVGVVAVRQRALGAPAAVTA